MVLQSRNAAHAIEEEREPDAQLSDPIAPDELARLRDFLGRRGLTPPPSYVQLLQISDGITGYMQLESLSLRSARELIAPEDDDAQWSDFAPLHEFVIASGNTSAFVSFDRRRVAPSGEMQVVWVDEAGSVTRFNDLRDFLASQLTFQQNIMTANQTGHPRHPED